MLFKFSAADMKVVSSSHSFTIFFSSLAFYSSNMRRIIRANRNVFVGLVYCGQRKARSHPDIFNTKRVFHEKPFFSILNGDLWTLTGKRCTAILTFLSGEPGDANTIVDVTSLPSCYTCTVIPVCPMLFKQLRLHSVIYSNCHSNTDHIVAFILANFSDD